MSENFNNETNEEKSKSSPSFFNTILWILAIYGALLLIDKNVTKLSFFRSVNQKVTSLFKETPKKKEFDNQKDVENQTEVDFNKPMESTEEIAVADFSPETYQIYNSSEYLKVINPNDDQKNQILTFLETKNIDYQEEGSNCNCNRYCYYCSKPIRGIKLSTFKYVINEYINNDFKAKVVESLLKTDYGKKQQDPFNDFYSLINSNDEFKCVPQSEKSRSSLELFCSKACVIDFNTSRY